MNHNFFNNEQFTAWLNGFNNNDWQNLLKNSQEKAMQFFGATSAKVTEHAQNMTAAQANNLHQNMTLILENFKANLIANNLEHVVTNNHQLIKDIIANNIENSKEMLSQFSNLTTDVYTHIVDKMMKEVETYAAKV
jgi:ribose 5-phosphate isomerase